ncbi:hypothetical protein NE237_001570 [Protea cynaroides]|uniref:Uncharacterized protein n=1 Tax=Protea cynaroides TaxID=273540 RepID=A0A9Q0KUE7_9MAGN|nr:hypothetical protein NE237_001570 [Protea cynaroides]
MANEPNDQRLLRLEQQLEKVSKQMMKVLQAFQRREESSTNRPPTVYRNGHDCKKLFFIELDQGPEETNELHLEEVDANPETEPPEISLHALMAKIADTPITVLIDSGSTHNFFNKEVPRVSGLPIEVGPPMRVMIASGEKLNSMGLCKQVSLYLLDSPFQIDFLLLPLEGCDAVLGAQWLQTLGPILWNFKNMEMKFRRGMKTFTLQGIKTLEAQLVRGKTLYRALKQNQGRGTLLKISLLLNQEVIHPEAWQDIQ